MATGRIIQRSIVCSERQAKLSCDAARVLYRDMLVHADINGCYHGNPTIVKSHIFTLYEDALHNSEAVRQYIDDMDKLELVKKYQVEGKDFIWFPDFIDKQPGLIKDRETPEFPITPEIEKANSLQWEKKIERKAKQKASYKETKPVIAKELPSDVAEIKAYYERLFMKKITLNDFQVTDMKRIITEFGIDKTKKAVARLRNEYNKEYQGIEHLIKYINELVEA